MLFKKFRLKIIGFFCTVLLLSIAGCNPFSQTSSLEKIQAHNKIVMGTINSSLTYAFDGTSHSGFDYELGLEFAEFLNIELQVKEYDTLSELFSALDNEEIDFIGAGLTLTHKRALKYRSSPPYYKVSQKVVYHKGTYRPRKITDIKEPVGVLEGSSHEETLQKMSANYPNLQITILKNEDQESLLRKVADKEIKFALVDSATLAQKQRYYPVLAEALTISKDLPVAWLIKRNQDNTVYSAMVEFIGDKYQDQTIANLTEKYFGHVERFDFVDTKIFLKRIETILPKYEKLFKQHTTPDINWQLLAAISYQESHWNPKAKSPTGVRGMMMLTRPTAKSVGISNRLDPKQSIQGGAKYLTQLLKRLPDSIQDSERIWFALASYNIGYGHLMDARRITAKKKQNPDSWADVKENLPLLHQKKWYKKTRYGYARGKEAQLYVNNIRQYYKTLTWFIGVKENKAAQEKIRQAAKEKALKEQQAQQKALNNEQLLAQIDKEILAKEKALEQAKAKVLTIEKALQKAKDKTAAEEQSRDLAKKHALALQEALKENEAHALAAQKAFYLAKEKILKEQTALQEKEEIAHQQLEFYQQARDEAFSAQQAYQQAKEASLTEQQQLIREKQQALAKQQQYQKLQEKKLATEAKVLAQNQTEQQENNKETETEEIINTK